MADRVDRREVSKQARWWKFTSIVAVLAVVISGVVGPSFAAFAESVPDDSTMVEPQPVVVDTPAPAITAPVPVATLPPVTTPAPSTTTAPIVTEPTPTVPSTTPSTTPTDPEAKAVLAPTSTIGVVAALEDVPAKPLPKYLTVRKTVSDATPDPGQPFTYNIEVKCSEASCLGARLFDVLPADLAGYKVDNVTVSPAEVPHIVTWAEGAGIIPEPEVVGSNTSLTVDFNGTVTAPIGSGLQNGNTFNVLVTLQVPADLKPGTTTIVNTAKTTASNAADGSSSATITVDVPVKIRLTTTKTWTPNDQVFQKGAPSVVTLGATNTSNVGLDSLVIQEPKNAAEGASVLDGSNPFTITEFTGFGPTPFVLPAGASDVRVDAYVYSEADKWHWVTGLPGATPTLLSTIDAGDVGGLRFTYTPTAPGTIAPAAKAAVEIKLGQLAVGRTGADLSTESHTVNNVSTATATSSANPPSVSKDANASYKVTPPKVAVSATKSIDKPRISAGDSAIATISANNGSDIDAKELRLSDLDYFTADIIFGGFTEAPVWPTGATSASVEYKTLVGGTVTSVPFLKTATPDKPAGTISGFEIVYTSADGAILKNTATSAKFKIVTTEGAPLGKTTNTVTSKVIASNDVIRTGTSSADLTLVKPGIDVTIKKLILPATSVRPGEPVIMSLTTKLSRLADSNYVIANKLVIEDSLSAGERFWDAFDLSEIAATQVPANTSLKVEVLTEAVPPWRVLKTEAAVGTASIFSMTESQISDALGAIPISTVTGIRFTFENASLTGFPSITNITPYVVAKARGALRSKPAVATNTDPTQPTEYKNVATAVGSGKTTPGTPVTTTAFDKDTAMIVIDTGGPGTGGINVAKKWSGSTVNAQTGDHRSTDLTWRVSPGYKSVTITDPTAPATPETTVFQAFDLHAINAIPASTAPFTNGWYLRYDTITSIELYRGGTWMEVPAPAGGWITPAGKFVGYNLSDSEIAASTGIRIVLTENTAARAAAQTAAGFDPYAPLLGTGVASSSVGGVGDASRFFTLDWQLRDIKRVGGKPVTSQQMYNGGTGIVSNTVGLSAKPIAAGGEITTTASATIGIIDQPPLVAVSKTVTVKREPTIVPYPNTTAAVDYPTATYTLTANNGSFAPASHVRVTDPPSCGDGAEELTCAGDATVAGAIADPFTPIGRNWLNPADGPANAFDRYDITKLVIDASIPAEVDLGASTVWLLHYNSGTGVYTSSATTATAANALDANEMSDVIGVSVSFKGIDPVTGIAPLEGVGRITRDNKLTITMESRLRTTIRSSNAVQALGAGKDEPVTNRVFAQSYDPVLNNTIVAADLAKIGHKLTGGVIDVAPTKTVSPTKIIEANRSDAVTVTLGANQGASTLSTALVWMRDDNVSSPEFWDRFDFTGLGAISAPDGADRVTVSVLYGQGGVSSWIPGLPTAIVDAKLPVAVSDLSQIHGIELTFTRSTPGFYSPVLPAAGWSTTAVFTARLRDTYRTSGKLIVLDKDVTVHNTVTVQSDRLNGEQSSEKNKTAELILGPGSHELSVNKLTNAGNRFGSIGSSVPFDLTFRNNGQGYLTIEELRDTLPATLLFLGDRVPVATPQTGGLLPAFQNVAIDGRDIVFTWPEGSRTMAPGETYNIRIWLELQPVSSGAKVENTMTVRTAETLDSCSHIGNGKTTGAWTTAPTTCGTTDYVMPAVGANLFTVKGVVGAVPGAFVPNNPGAVCAPTLSTVTGNYYRTPCVANSVIGGTDRWTLQTLNAGTVDVSEMTVFDQLPVRGDSFLVSGATRNSAYRPRIVAGSLKVSAPEGAIAKVQVTADDNVCANTWNDLATQEPCEQSGEAWVAAGSVDWAKVSGVRVIFDFSKSTGGVLASGQSVNVTYETVNVVANGSDPSGASAIVPAADEFAYNQFGVKYRNFGADDYSQIAANAVGVHLMTGPIRIDKVITGAGAQYAPDAFDVDVMCSIGETSLDLGSAAILTLDATNDYSARIDGVPVGAKCNVTEQGDLGAFGESGRTGSTSDLLVKIQAGADAVVPDAQIATITNDYAVTEVAVTKVVTGARPTADLAFTVSLSCTVDRNGVKAPVTIPGGATRLLATPDRLTATYTGLPTRAACSITETDRGGAITTAVSIGGVVTTGATASFVTPALGTADPVGVVVSNDYDDTSSPPPPSTTPTTPSTPGSGVPFDAGTRPPTGGSVGGPLPTTGSGALDLLLAAIAVTLAGVGLLTVGRNRRDRGRRGHFAAGH